MDHISSMKIHDCGSNPIFNLNSDHKRIQVKLSLNVCVSKRSEQNQINLGFDDKSMEEFPKSSSDQISFYHAINKTLNFTDLTEIMENNRF